MKKVLTILFISCCILSNTVFAYSASSLKREINYIQSEIRQNERKINSIKSSDKISQYDKKRKIKALENKNYYNKRKIQRIKSEYKRAIS